MKAIVSRVLMAAVLVAFGFGMGLLMAPKAAQSEGCLGYVTGGGKQALLGCPGTYEFMANPEECTEITGCRLGTWSKDGKIYHSALVTVIKR